MIDEKKLINDFLKKPYEELEIIAKEKFDIVHDFLLKKYNISRRKVNICR